MSPYFGLQRPHSRFLIFVFVPASQGSTPFALYTLTSRFFPSLLLDRPMTSFGPGRSGTPKKQFPPVFTGGARALFFSRNCQASRVRPVSERGSWSGPSPAVRDTCSFPPPLVFPLIQKALSVCMTLPLRKPILVIGAPTGSRQSWQDRLPIRKEVWCFCSSFTRCALPPSAF